MWVRAVKARSTSSSTSVSEAAANTSSGTAVPAAAASPAADWAGAAERVAAGLGVPIAVEATPATYKAPIAPSTQRASASRIPVFSITSPWDRGANTLSRTAITTAALIVDRAADTEVLPGPTAAAGSARQNVRMTHLAHQRRQSCVRGHDRLPALR